MAEVIVTPSPQSTAPVPTLTPQIHSPFYIVQEFLSPQQCENIIKLCNFKVAQKDHEENFVKTSQKCESAEQTVYQRFRQLYPALEKHYGMKIKGTSVMSFDWYPEGFKVSKPVCDNSSYVVSKWMKTHARDLSGILFLNDYQNRVPLDEKTESFGGQVEFPQHKFTFNNQRGTLIVFPSGPQFIQYVTPVHIGNAYMVKFFVVAEQMWIFDPKKFPGNYLKWFESVV